MCLITKENIQIATEDIHVCKILGDRWGFLFKKFWNSPYMNTWHRFNKVLEAVKHLNQSISSDNRLREITKGFHALVDLKEIDGYLRVHAIIPTGSEYCLGIRGDIVSNKLIVFSSNWRYKRYVSISERAKKNS